MLTLKTTEMYVRKVIICETDINRIQQVINSTYKSKQNNDILGRQETKKSVCDTVGCGMGKGINPHFP